jgi:hypothetical protein
LYAYNVDVDEENDGELERMSAFKKIAEKAQKMGVKAFED